MELLVETVGWFTDPANWSGRNAIPVRVAEHIAISTTAVVLAVVVALPTALYIGHTGRGGFLVISLANIGRALPSYALLVILFGFFVGVSSDANVVTNGPTLLAMTALAVPPIVTNTYTALRELDRELLEAARGMGMRGTQMLRRVEIPLALPIILAGVRTATVQVVATAALGAVIGSGGLGRYIIQGIARLDEGRLIGGAVLIALLAIGADLLLGWLARRTVSPGLAAASEHAVPATAGVPVGRTAR